MCLHSYLFGFVQLILQGLFGDFHLNKFLSQSLVFFFCLCSFFLYILQLMVKSYRHILGNLSECSGVA